jgi:hypothetical protein
MGMGIPDAPFKKNWDEMALKRLIHHAAENGYDGIAVTPGQEQAKRYDLSKQIGRIKHMNPMGNPNKHDLHAFDHDGRLIFEKYDLSNSELSEYIGKEAAQKLLGQKPNESGRRDLSGLDLKFGGEGMKGFYDKKVPTILNNIGKKYGVKTELNGVSLDNNKFHYFPITLEMKKDVLQNGLPMYRDGGLVQI